MAPLLLCDVTRLVSRRNAAAPGGIERVDLRLATYLRDRHDAILVAQNGPALVCVPSDLGDSFLEHLRAVWGNGESHLSFEEPFRACGVVSGPSKNERPPVRIRHRIRREFKRKLKPIRWLVGAIRVLSRRLFDETHRVRAPRSELLPVEPELRPRPTVVEDSPFYLADDLRVLLTVSSDGLIYCNFSHFNLNNEHLFRTLSSYKARFLISVHDVIPIDWPEYVQEGDAESVAQRLQQIFNADAHIVCPTKDVQGRITRLASEWEIPPPSVSVLPNGTEAIDPKSANPTDLGRPYFIVIGTIEGRKNHLLLLQIWRRLSERMPKPPLLIVIGRRGWANGSVVDLLDRCPALQSNVLELNSIPDDSMFEYLAGAQALLFPSFAEGWGIPAVEALSLGVPAICSDIPALREATQGCAEYIDPYDLPAWEKAVLDFSSPTSERRQLAIEQVRRFRPILWDEVHAKLERVIEQSK